MQARLQLEFEGTDRKRLVERALASGLLPASAPTTIKVDHVKVAERTLPTLVETSGDLSITWSNGRLHSNLRRDYLLISRIPFDVTIETILALLHDLPFEACTTARLDPSWWPGYLSIHGWAFALKGAGHRLVSPRVIERGPWLRWRDDEADLTLFQFHELDIDGATALEQARPGHALLAPMWRGGHYASETETFRDCARASGYQPSFYDKATRTSIVLVQDGEVSPKEIGIAAGTRIHQVFPEPVEQVAFVYMDEATARRQLPTLWLYGLEVRAMTAKGERRIDQDYQPPPTRESPQPL